MARFERGDDFVEIWIEPPVERIDQATGNVVHQWPELRSRSGRIAWQFARAQAGARLLVGWGQRRRCFIPVRMVATHVETPHYNR